MESELGDFCPTVSFWEFCLTFKIGIFFSKLVCNFESIITYVFDGNYMANKDRMKK